MSQPFADIIKLRQLRRHKIVATGLFVLMMIVYIATTWALTIHPMTWLGYINAFAEAAMVGALADWFAVTALFHHPLGIRIPHTNLIEKKKDAIGDNLGDFVVSNFLNAATLRPYIKKLSISKLLIQWLSHKKNEQLVAQEITHLLKSFVQTADATIIAAFFSTQAKKLLQNLQLHEVVAAGLDIIIERGDHARLLDHLIINLHNYIIQNEDMVRERVKKESHFLIPGFVDNMIASRITGGLARYLAEIRETPNHKIRKEIDNQLAQIIADLRSGARWQQELHSIKETLLKGDKIEQYAGSLWEHLKTSILNDLNKTDSSIAGYLQNALSEQAARLKNDIQLQEKLDAWVQFNAYQYTLKNAAKVGVVISNTVGGWQGKELSNKLELEVGKDLQYIRINGTIVGGLVGLIIYTITRLIENS